MIYILDTSFIADIQRLHMPYATFPDFWEKLLELGRIKLISMPTQVYKEITRGNDEVSEWVKKYKTDLIDQENIAFTKVAEVMARGYGVMDEDILEELKADPYVIAHALALNGSVVTSEKMANKDKPSNKKIPQVCEVLGIPYMTATRFIWEIRAYL